MSENQIEKYEEKSVAIGTDSQAGDVMLSMIERVCTDPNFDIAKMEKMVAMRDAEMARVAKQEFAKAFCQMQSEMPIIPKNKKVKYTNNNGKVTEYDFADLAQITKFLQPIAKKHSFSFSHSKVKGDPLPELVTVLMHSEGHEISTFRQVKPDTSGGKNEIQGEGSAASYAKRYNLLDLFGIASEDEDNDGQTIHMDSEELSLIKSKISKATTIEALNKAKEDATANKSRMSKQQILEIKAEIEKVRKDITNANN